MFGIVHLFVSMFLLMAFGAELGDFGMVIGLRNLFFTMEIALKVGWHTKEATIR